MQTKKTAKDFIHVGIIGAGAIAADHVKGVNSHPQARVMAIADQSAQRCNEAAEKFEIPKTYTDYKQLISDPEIDAVIVGLPNYLHLPVSLAAFAADKHVLLEKPMALNLAEAKQIAEAAREAKKVLMLGMNMRFHPKVQTIKALVQRGDLGEVYQAKTYWLRRSGCPTFGTWFSQQKLAGGGVVLDIGVHALDMALYLLDNWQPLTVSAATYSKFGPRGLGEGNWGKSDRTDSKFEVEDAGIAFIRLAGGVTLTLETTWARHAEQANINSVELFGTAAGADALKGKIFRYGKEAGEYEVVEPQNVTLRHPRLNRQYHWLDVIAGLDEPDIKVEESLVVQSILDAIYESAKTGREVSPAD